MNFLCAALFRAYLHENPTGDSEFENGDGINTSAKFSHKNTEYGRHATIALDLNSLNFDEIG